MSSSEKGIDVAHIAALARLKLTDTAAAKLEKEMESIVTYVEMLSELDVDGIEPTAHAVPRSNVLREDVRGESFPRESMLANAPAVVDQELVRVPQVLAEEGMA
ncbi:MAG: Asp-tRNA(Asn)/Glu-tRNA(Gln) amidotransferase subunit GatC [Lentisphaeria bacterium]|nr:Asp-tRNA(Asn)/Glu-tRNA(Gln) amidotransferase subunit GatC [Lentisphaeria bacterium]